MKMRKNKSTKLLKIGILFFGITLLWNCEKNEEINDITNQTLSNESPFETITFEKIVEEKEFNEITKESNTEKYFNESISKNHFKSSNQPESFYIIKETVKKVKIENYTSYTFLIKRDRKFKGKNSFENLIIEKRKNQIIAFIIEYQPSEEYIKNTDLPFSGKINIKKVDYKPSYLEREQDIDCINITIASCRQCSEHGSYGYYNSKCSNSTKSEYVYTSVPSCFNGGGSGFGGDDEVDTFIVPSDSGEGSDGYKDTGSYTGVNPPCGDIVHGCDKEDQMDEENEDDQIINELTGKDL
ncbi:hypothetical protein [Polaribacter sp. IC073]|uniref:hypothetical protein n=1 Tax=Polaribacter sp. IC073 TaxID=2508540 RepID=UPI0011BFD7B5|nr:hypothetical protein [Polaribacter sp. IC073]TXD49996.1 hypothetical protein ES045_02105 [Polaribacter sp. IC073]